MPVEEQGTSSFFTPSRCGANSVIRYALSRPGSPVAQWALPLLTITACALPLLRRSWQTITGAARVVLVVNVPAATHGTSEAKIPRSLIVLSDLMPHAVTPARKPWGAVTQLSTSRNMSDNEKYLLKLGTRSWEPGAYCWLHCTIWKSAIQHPSSADVIEPADHVDLQVLCRIARAVTTT